FLVGLTLGLLGPWANPARAINPICGDEICALSETETCPQDCGVDPYPCYPFFQCSRLYSTCVFYKQNTANKCVYNCYYTETCVDVNSCEEPYEASGVQKFKIGPFPPNQCPFGEASIALTGTPE
ncbi:MAG TPA: hypothetical protein VN851_17685, partial [Thermoanaerobaculia bacterium]|nr:hypothetical protein [Thermoanaerobaculia bacterium]